MPTSLHLLAFAEGILNAQFPPSLQLKMTTKVEETAPEMKAVNLNNLKMLLVVCSTFIAAATFVLVLETIFLRRFHRLQKVKRSPCLHHR